MEHMLFTQLTIPELRKVFRQELEKYDADKQNNSPLTQPPAEIKYLSRKEAAKRLSVSLPTLQDWVKKGIISAYRINSRVLFKENELLAAPSRIKT